MKMIKIVPIFLKSGALAKCEQELEKYVNDGWEIKAAGGAGSPAGYGFIVLQKEDKEQKSRNSS
ncbi:MAG: hypothetical protein Kow0042_11850 [Calditrichia bacterium]